MLHSPLPRFTFHYVSIKTHCLRNGFIDYCNFTFHYVSIKTTSFMQNKNHQPTLHSTMYLLKPPRKQFKTLILLTLHSTMYLLKQTNHNQLYRQIETLHSTMYLLKHIDLTCLCTGLLLYIPLCIY